METFARVVVGVDGTEWGFEALRQALVLAPDDGSAVHAITALDASAAVWTGFNIALWQELLEHEAVEARDQAAAMLADHSDSDARVVRGPPVRVLRQARDDTHASLLALGGRHSSRFLGIMLGGTATELLHDGACSVLIARPHPEQTWRPRTVVVGVDGSAAALAGLRIADEFAPRLGAALEVVAAGGIAASEADAEWVERVDTREEAHPVDALLERSQSVDLVVVGSRGLHALRALGSVSERVAHRSKCSVLIVHPPAADSTDSASRS